MRRSSLLLLILTVTAACAEPLELADWRIDVPPGTEVIGLPAVPPNERSRETVRLVDDLVIGDDADNAEALLYRPLAIVAAADGRMFVADRGDSRVVMFAPDGQYLGSFGREGQGPGEFGSIFGLAISGNRILVDDYGNNRLSVWSLGGELVDDRPFANRHILQQMGGLDDGTYASTSIETDAGNNRHLVAAVHRLDGGKRQPLLDIPLPAARVVRHDPGIMYKTEDLVRGDIATLGFPDLLQAAGNETIYLSPAHEYQVLAVVPGGGTRWALRVAWPRPSRSVESRQLIVDRAVRSGDLPASVDDFDWPPAEALEFLRTDGAGRLYVFPTMPREKDEPAGPRMVDVYSPEGELLAAGWVDHVWSHARGDYVYGLRTNAREEQIAVRYRLTVNGR